MIDFAISAVQAVDRALLVDTLPPEQQAAGNACAALMLNTGSVVGFLVCLDFTLCSTHDNWFFWYAAGIWIYARSSRFSTPTRSSRRSLFSFRCCCWRVTA